MNKKTTDSIIDALEKEGFSVKLYDDKSFEIGKYSSAGQDFSFNVKGDTKSELENAIYEYYQSYDPDEEASYWLKDGHGVNGAPYAAKDVIEDMEECKGFILDAYEILHNGHKTADTEYSSVFYDNLIVKFEEEFTSDEEPYDKKGRRLVQAVKENDIENIFIALCGWSFDTLVNKVNEDIKSAKKAIIDEIKAQIKRIENGKDTEEEGYLNIKDIIGEDNSWLTGNELENCNEIVNSPENLVSKFNDLIEALEETTDE